MIRNFDEVRTQLAELSDVINRFKSEQVQLKIVELIFRATSGEELPDQGAVSPKKRGRRAKKEEESPGSEVDTKKRAARGDGPVPTLEKFVQEGFFNQKRTIGAVVDHLQSQSPELQEQ